MPRSYPFDHFTVSKHETPVNPASDKARVAGKVGPRGDGRPPRYGKRFAQTEELAHVRQMNHQLEELAGIESPKLSTPREPEPVTRAASVTRGAPIGALPLPSPAPAPESFRDLLGAGTRQLRLLRQSFVDGAAASYQLATLPLQAVALTARWGLRSLQLAPWPT